MTKKEENPQNLSTNFRIKIVKKLSPEEWAEIELAKELVSKINKDALLSGTGIMAQLKDKGKIVKYNSKPISIESMKEVFGELFNKNPTTKDRNIKLYVDKNGLDAFNKALIDDQIKNIKKKDEHRKRLSFQNKILKQTYKFR